MEPAERILRVDAQWVSLNPQVDIWLDVAEFEHAIDMAHEASDRPDSRSAVNDRIGIEPS